MAKMQSNIPKTTSKPRVWAIEMNEELVTKNLSQIVVVVGSNHQTSSQYEINPIIWSISWEVLTVVFSEYYSPR